MIFKETKITILNLPDEALVSVVEVLIDAESIERCSQKSSSTLALLGPAMGMVLLVDL